MKSLAFIILQVALFVMLASTAYSEDRDLALEVMNSPRVVVLPFANYTETADARDRVTGEVYHEFEDRGIDFAPAQDVAGILRKYRLRQTNALRTDDLKILSSEAQAAYVLSGSVQRLVDFESGSELALCARLISMTDLTVVWTNCESSAAYDDGTIFASRHHSVDKLIDITVRRLFNDFPLNAHAQKLRSVNIAESELPASVRRIAMVPLDNETLAPMAADALTADLFHALCRHGFDVVEPGRVREVMLDKNELIFGQCSADLLNNLRQKLGVSVVVSGTVSQYSSAQALQFGDSPHLAFELRAIDTADTSLIWSRSFEASGAQFTRLFGTGAIHDISTIVEKLTRKAARAIPSLPLAEGTVQ